MKQTIKEDRVQAIALLQAGHRVSEVAEQLKRSPQWVRKWWQRYEDEGVRGLQEKSRTPRLKAKQMPEQVREAIIVARLKLESKAQSGGGLKYIGGPAIRTELKNQKVTPLPSVATIERVLRQVKMTRKKKVKEQLKIKYPHLRPQVPHELSQVDIVPHYLQGGERVACFNGLDVVSRYPTGQAKSQRRSLDAAHFLIHLWQTVGIAKYTQLDNEGCFSGGTTHPYVLGRVVRLALQVGTEVVFSPVYHPQSNGYVERFHQDYDYHVWDDTYLPNLEAVNKQASNFFTLYRHSGHHSRLNGSTPTQAHFHSLPRFLADDFQLSETKLPLTPGRVHFIRRVQADRTVRVLNVDWTVPAEPDTGLWATLDIHSDDALLSIFDQAPDVQSRTCLISHPFPLNEHPVQSSPIPTTPHLIQLPSLPLSTTHSSSFLHKVFLLAQDRLSRIFFRSDQLLE